MNYIYRTLNGKVLCEDWFDTRKICPLTLEDGKYTRTILLKYLGETFPTFTEEVILDILYQACSNNTQYIEELIEQVKWRIE